MTTMPVMLLSIDVGIHNLAVCVLKLAMGCKPEIVYWTVQDILENQEKEGGKKKKSLGFFDLSKALMIKLNEMVDDDLITGLGLGPERIGTVIIEQQPKINSKMKNLAMWIFAYFVFRGFSKVEFVPPRNKAFIDKKKKRTTYTERKKCAEGSAREWMDIFQIPAHFLHWFNVELKKKDDAADALLQAIAYAQNRYPKILSSFTYYKDIVVVKNNTQQQEEEDARKSQESTQESTQEYHEGCRRSRRSRSRSCPRCRPQNSQDSQSPQGKEGEGCSSTPS